MRRAGCGLAIFGALLCVGSFALFGTSIFRAFDAHEAHVATVEPGASWTSGTITVDTRKFVQVAVRGTVRSDYSERNSGDDGWRLLYAFPFEYTVYDGDGRVLHQQSKPFSDEAGGKTAKNTRVTDRGGSSHVEHGFDKFQVAAPGTIRVVASLDPDPDYRATLENGEVVIYDNVSKHAARVGIGVGLLVGGGGLAFIGFILVIIAAARGGGR